MRRSPVCTGGSGVCNGKVLAETGTHRQELEWPLESWPSGSERASRRVEKGP